MGFFENLKIKKAANNLGLTIDEYTEFTEAQKLGISVEEYKNWLNKYKQTLNLEEYAAFCKAIKVKGNFYIDSKPHITEHTALQYAKNHKRISLDMFLKYCDQEHCYAEAGFGILGLEFQYDAYIKYLDKFPIHVVNDAVCENAEKFIIEYSKNYVREHSVIKNGVLEEYSGKLFDLFCVPDEVHTIADNALNKTESESFETYNILFHNNFKHLGFSNYISIGDFTTSPYKEKRLQEALWKYRLPESIEYIAEYDEFSFGSISDTIIAPVKLKGSKVFKGRKVKWVGEVKKATEPIVKEEKPKVTEPIVKEEKPKATKIENKKMDANIIASKEEPVDLFYGFDLGFQPMSINNDLSIIIPNSFVFGKNVNHTFKSDIAKRVISITYDLVAAFNDNSAKLDKANKATLAIEISKGDPIENKLYDFSDKDTVDKILRDKYVPTRMGDTKPKKVIGKKELYVEYSSGLRLFESSEYAAIILNKNNYYTVRIYFNYENRKISKLKKATEENIVKSWLKTIEVLQAGEAEEIANAYVPFKKTGNAKNKVATKEPALEKTSKPDNNLKKTTQEKATKSAEEKPATSKEKNISKATDSKVNVNEITLSKAPESVLKKANTYIVADQGKNLENTAYPDCEKRLIFFDAEYEKFTICNSLTDVNATVINETESGATLQLQNGEKIIISDNSELNLPTDKKVVKFFSESYYTYILFEDGKIRVVKRSHPQKDVLFLKSLAERMQALSEVKDFLVFNPSGDYSPSIVATVHSNGTVSVIEGKKAAEKNKEVLDEVSSLQNVEQLFAYGYTIVAFFKDGSIKTLVTKQDKLSKYKYKSVKKVNEWNYLITTENKLVVVSNFGVVHEISNTTKVVYDHHNLYFLSDENIFSNSYWRPENDDRAKPFCNKGVVKDFWILHGSWGSCKIVVLYEEGFAIVQDGSKMPEIISNVMGAECDNGELYLYISKKPAGQDNSPKATLKSTSLEEIKRKSLLTLEQIYRRLGDLYYYYQGTTGFIDFRISGLDYELLKKDPMFIKFSEKAKNSAASVLVAWRSPHENDFLKTTPSFGSADILFKWDDIVSLVELAYFINNYNLPSFKAELYLAEHEDAKSYCLTLTNEDEMFKIKTRRN